MGFFSSLFGRTSRVIRGQVNQGMDAVEDATFEATLKQTVRDMKEELNHVVRTSAEAMSNHNRLEAEYNKYARQSEEWMQRARKALQAGSEELARKALAKKGECEKQMASMESSLEMARNTSAMLRKRVSELKERINEADRNATTLIARRNAAMAQKKVAQALAGTAGGENAFAALKQFEESVSREEAQAQAFDHLASGGSDSELEEEFAALATTEVDSDLLALKAEIGGTPRLSPPKK